MRLDFAGLCALQGSLERGLVSGALDVKTYVAEWDRIVELAGWTWQEVLDQIDHHWTTKLVCVEPFVS